MGKESTVTSIRSAGDRRGANADRPCVARVARMLAAVASPGPASKAWTRLGFDVSPQTTYLGCRAFDIGLSGGGLRFLAPAAGRASTTLATLLADRLVLGAGLLGWSWGCTSVDESWELIRARSGCRPGADDRQGPAVLAPDLNPGAATVLEYVEEPSLPSHPNRIVGLDHVILAVSDADAAADRYERNFGLNAERRTIAGHRYALVTVGAAELPAIEIVGPTEPERGPLSGHVQGVAFRSDDLDATTDHLRRARVPVREPHPALRGGRITGLPMQLGGVQIAFLGD